MTRKLRGQCRVCKFDVATITHQVAGTGHATCRGSNRPAILPVGMLR